MSSVQLNHAYAFIGGAFVGRFTGIIPSVIISGVLLYVADPSVFTIENIMTTKTLMVNVVNGVVK